MRCRWTIAGCARLFWAALLAAVFVAAAEGGTVVPMTLPEMSDYAGQVIVGEIVTVRSYWAENPRRIESEVTFKDVEYLKGALSNSTSMFTLIVPGGKVGDWEMRISCAPTLGPGERWVLFLLPSYKTFPVVGLDQGGFRLEPDAEGVARVYDVSRRAVTGLGSDGFVQVAGESAGHASHQHGASNGDNSAVASAVPSVAGGGSATARGELVSANSVRVQFVGPPAPALPAMSYDDFVALIRPTLERSKAHALTAPAGRPEPVRYSAMPFQKSPARSPADPQGAVGERTGQPVIRDGGAPVRRADVPLRKADKASPDAAERAKEVRP